MLEANPRRAGGGLGSEERTLPGFVHESARGSFRSARPAPRSGRWTWRARASMARARYESCHPALDGSVACIARGDAIEAAPFGSARDGGAFRELARFHAGIEPDLLGALLGPFPSLGPLLRVGLGKLLRIAGLFVRSGAGLAPLFETEAARRVLPGLGLHVDVGPDDMFGAPLATCSGLTATTGGYAFPKGGAQRITNAMVTRLDKRAAACGWAPGSRASSSAAAARPPSSWRTGRRSRRAARWSPTHRRPRCCCLCSRTPTSRSGCARSCGVSRRDGERSRWTGRCRRRCPGGSRPPGRARSSTRAKASTTCRGSRARCAPASCPTIRTWSSASTARRSRPRAAGPPHAVLLLPRPVPRRRGLGRTARERFADRVEARIEGLAPGFRASILARLILSPPDLEAKNANLVGGDLGGGSNAWHRQLLFRPVFPYFRYRMPVPGLYLCSSYAHPGAGVHGMCGYNAALIAAHDADRRGVVA